MLIKAGKFTLTSFDDLEKNTVAYPLFVQLEGDGFLARFDKASVAIQDAEVAIADDQLVERAIAEMVKALVAQGNITKGSLSGTEEQEEMPERITLVITGGECRTYWEASASLSQKEIEELKKYLEDGTVPRAMPNIVERLLES